MALPAEQRKVAGRKLMTINQTGFSPAWPFARKPISRAYVNLYLEVDPKAVKLFLAGQELTSGRQQLIP